MQAQTETRTAKTKNGALPPHSSYVCPVYKTKDHSIFKLMDDNRIVDDIHVRRLVNSFKQHYLIAPITVNENFEVIDGQHRLQACKETELPIYYIIIHGYSIKEVQVLNTHQKNWTKADFLKMFVSQGREAYVTFQKFLDDFPEIDFSGMERIITLRQSQQLESRSITGKRQASAKDFQEGRLKIPNIEKSYWIASRIMDFKPFYKGFRRGVFVSTLMGLFNSKLYNHKEMLYKLKVVPENMRLTDVNNIEHFKLQLENIYNWKRANSHKVSFKYLPQDES